MSEAGIPAMNVATHWVNSKTGLHTNAIIPSIYLPTAENGECDKKIRDNYEVPGLTVFIFFSRIMLVLKYNRKQQCYQQRIT